MYSCLSDFLICYFVLPGNPQDTSLPSVVQQVQTHKLKNYKVYYCWNKSLYFFLVISEFRSNLGICRSFGPRTTKSYVLNKVTRCVSKTNVYVMRCRWQCANTKASTDFNECGRDDNGQCYKGACASLELKCEMHFRQTCMSNVLAYVVSEWVSEYGLTSPSTHYRSFRRQVFPVNHLHWYWQPNKNNQETEHTNNIEITQPERSP